MKYQKQSVFILAVLVIAALFWGYDAWQQSKVSGGDWPELDGGLYSQAVVREGVSYLVPGSEVYETGVEKDGIPAINDPKYISVLAADNVIADDLYGIDVEVNGEHRYYPYQIMNWHEVVNDTFGDQELAVTYCTLCGTPIVYDRNVDGQTVEFGVSGKVYNNNTLLYDTSSDALWLQATGQSVVGTTVGKTLTVYPSIVMRWSDWKSLYPNGEVLSTETGFTRDYTRHPYGKYETSNAIYFPINHTTSAFANKWVVSMVKGGSETAAFAREVLTGVGMQEATVGDVPMIGVYDFDLDIVRVFDRRVDGDTLTFTFDYTQKELRDSATDSLWDATGRAVSGKMKGTQLAEVTSTTSYWVCAHTMAPAIRPIGAETTAVDAKVEGDTLIVDTTTQNVTQ
ncbi:MAG: hypothetical protein UY72_C0012G0006 [Candidatus Uhrbacteria bacterium GW2011_GWD2_52_7]|uniref:DUF3179 domain-containing protein n=1 Tax=Candidatus Uhrbacteria bacterium GW2011_GWD2_52_7 TaxID=1618989 RepID=A0A0G1XHM9_9BACT|nr:MAG: hypothetical protein UY72_C0012G0006 [Candidatus Uhrbacteria bacterium GW2011_GWD2_52_7]